MIKNILLLAGTILILFYVFKYSSVDSKPTFKPETMDLEMQMESEEICQ